MNFFRVLNLNWFRLRCLWHIQFFEHDNCWFNKSCFYYFFVIEYLWFLHFWQNCMIKKKFEMFLFMWNWKKLMWFENNNQNFLLTLKTLWTHHWNKKKSHLFQNLKWKIFILQTRKFQNHSNISIIIKNNATIIIIRFVMMFVA